MPSTFKVRLAKSKSRDHLEVRGAMVSLPTGAFFCPEKAVELDLDEALDIDDDRIVLWEYGYPEGLETTALPFRLESFEELDARMEDDRNYVLGWYPTGAERAAMIRSQVRLSGFR